MKVITLGGGPAGIEASAILKKLGHEVVIIEKNDKIGGNISNWHQLFPDFKPSVEITSYLQDTINTQNIPVQKNTRISAFQRENGHFILSASNQKKYIADAIIVATGYDIFDARRKEEYGYGIYKNVITSADLEKKFHHPEGLLLDNGKFPERIAFIHCVGSRDEKCGNHYCSKVCCITGVKQAIEMHKKLPDAKIFCFYMDLRLYGQQFEEIYRKAQEIYHIQFIRGRLSEASSKIDGSIQIKAEDTLSGRPLKMDVDLLVLLVGIEPREESLTIAEIMNIEKSDSHFFKPQDIHISMNCSNQLGIFLAGSCTGPMSLNDTISHARSAATEVHNYLQNKK